MKPNWGTQFIGKETVASHFLRTRWLVEVMSNHDMKKYLHANKTINLEQVLQLFWLSKKNRAKICKVLNVPNTSIRNIHNYMPITNVIKINVFLF